MKKSTNMTFMIISNKIIRMKRHILTIPILFLFLSCISQQEKAENIVNKWLHREIKFTDSINTRGEIAITRSIPRVIPS